MKGQSLKAPPANPRAWAFSVIKCSFRFYPPKTEIRNIGGVKKIRLTDIGPRFVHSFNSEINTIVDLLSFSNKFLKIFEHINSPLSVLILEPRKPMSED